jgi:hypothetical protein
LIKINYLLPNRSSRHAGLDPASRNSECRFSLDSGFRRNDKSLRDNENLLGLKARGFHHPGEGH